MHDSATRSHALIHRVRSEFLEMPGLQLTPKQAQRLWGCDETTCQHVLDALVEGRFLRRTAPGAYRRVDDGPLWRLARRDADA
jgi:hypothetical protein